MASAVLLQNHEAVIILALSQDTDAAKDLRQLARDMFDLLEVIVNEAPPFGGR